MEISANPCDFTTKLGTETRWMLNSQHKRLILRILETLKDFKSSQTDLISALFQLRVVVSTLNQYSLEISLFKETIECLSKFMILYKDDDQLILEVIETAKTLRNSVDFYQGLQVLLHISNSNANKGAIASLESVSFIMYLFVTFQSSKEWSFKELVLSIKSITEAFLEVKHTLMDNVNVALFLKDILKFVSGRQINCRLETLSEDFQQGKILFYF